ncbi:tail fiber domain-containing protein [Diaphorobacter sp. DS2]|nr:tail fiber domain-containing protein [Diaphorobacter sp. DS2]
MEIEDYPGTNKAPKVTLSTLRKTYGSALTDYTKSLFDEFFDKDTGKLKYDVLDEATRRATEALNNSLTELEYPPGMGIVARDPEDPLRFVAFRSAGLGVTTDGGVTFPNAITADGINTNLLTAGQINTNRIRIFGGDLSNYTNIEGNTIEARGKHRHSWFGEEYNEDTRLRLQWGYFIAESMTRNQRLYYNSRGISTTLIGSGAEEEAESGNGETPYYGSGVIEFFSHRYDPDIRGLTVSSNRGILALKTYTRDIILDSSRDIKLWSGRGDITLRPMNETRSGNNEFRMYIKDNASPSDTDGVIVFGSPGTNYASGLRFQKTSAGDAIVYATNGNGDRGTGTFDAAKVQANEVTTRSGSYGVYWNGRGGGTLGGSGANEYVLKAGGIQTTGDNLYLGCYGTNDGEVRVTNNLGYNDGGTIGYRPIKASEYRNGSSVLTKQNIEPVTESGLDVINKLEIKRYVLNEDVTPAITQTGKSEL